MLGVGFAPGMSLAAKAMRIGGLILAVIAIAALSYCQGRSDGKAGVELKQQKAITSALEVDRAARELADAERQNDQTAVFETKKELNDAVDQAVSTGNDPAIALACERLRRLPPRLGVGIPPECGRGAGDAAKANPNP